MSRCIELDFVKVPGADQTKLAKTTDEEAMKWTLLRDALYRLMLLDWKNVVKAQKWLKTDWKGVTGRTFDKWLPLATMAAMVSEEVLDEVTELAKESLDEQRQNAGDTFEAIIFQYARWLVREGDQILSESEIWTLFTEVDTHRSNRWKNELPGQDSPVWATEPGTHQRGGQCLSRQ